MASGRKIEDEREAVRCLRAAERAGLALLSLRYGQQLGDAVVEPRELLDELSILLGDLRELSTQLGILLSQRFQLIHRPVEITLGDPCRSSSPLS